MGSSEWARIPAPRGRAKLVPWSADVPRRYRRALQLVSVASARRCDAPTQHHLAAAAIGAIFCVMLAALVVCSLGCAAQSSVDHTPAALAPPLRVYSLRADALQRAKQRVHGTSSAAAYTRLVSEADAALQAGPFSVMDKRRAPSSRRARYVSSSASAMRRRR